MNILIAINSKYVMPAYTMLTSLFENNPGKHNIYLFFGDLKSSEIKYLKELCYRNGSEFEAIQVNDSLFSDAPLGAHFSIEVYYRLLVHKLLPNILDRVLWIDSDMIIRKNLTDFYNQDMKTKCIVACENLDSEKDRIRLGLSNSHIYFNSGLILFDLKKIRTWVKDETIQYCIEKYKEVIIWPDQDVLNLLYSGKIHYADAKIYNRQILGTSHIDRKQLSDISSNAAVVHYVGSAKPWRKRYANFADKYFLAIFGKQKPFTALGLWVTHRVFSIVDVIKGEKNESRSHNNP